MTRSLTSIAKLWPSALGAAVILASLCAPLPADEPVVVDVDGRDELVVELVNDDTPLQRAAATTVVVGQAAAEKPKAEAPEDKAAETVEADDLVEDAPVAQPANKAGEDADKKSVDAKLEKDIERIKADLEKLKKGTAAYDLKEAELKRKQRELERKAKLAAQNEDGQQPIGPDPTQPPEEVLDGAMLPTDDEVDNRLLPRARHYAEQDQYAEACTIWQHVLNHKEFPDLMTRYASPHVRQTASSNVVYQPVRRVIEAELAAMPAAGLAEYRLAADAEARALLTRAENSEDAEAAEAALDEIVRRYFVSSLGDDAAYRLACMRLDRYDFVGARRLLSRIRQTHPDPSIPAADILLRTVLASARAGDADGATKALAELKALDDSTVPAGLLDTLERELSGAAPTVAGIDELNEWRMALGTPSRSGIVKSLPGDPVEAEQLWTEQPIVDGDMFDYKVPDQFEGRVHMSGRNQATQSRPQLVKRWKEQKWTPTSQALLADGKVFIKTHDELRFYDLHTRKLAATPIKEAKIKLPKNSNVWVNGGYYGSRQPDQPSTQEEVAHFGDRSAKSMALIDDTLYHIEGRAWLAGVGQQVRIWANGQQRELGGNEKLCAVNVNAKGGKQVRWRYPTGDDAVGEVTIPAAPVPFAKQVILPVIRNAELRLVAVNAATGKAVWDTFLCGVPGGEGGSPRWATVGVAIVGSEVYVASGYGVIFALDAASGTMHWATKYERSKPANENNNRFGGVTVTIRPGFEDDVVIPHGDRLIVLPSDAERIYCYSRIDGAFLFHARRDDARYCLGVIEGGAEMDDGVVVAGPKAARRISLRTGKVEWHAGFHEDAASMGRGVLTTNGVYIPTEKQIVRIDPKGGKRLGVLRAATRVDDPVGNLFTDGEHLIAMGIDRVYKLVDGEAKLAELTEQIERKDDPHARMERAFLYGVIDRRDDALNDMRRAHELFSKGEDRDKAGRKLLDALLAKAQRQPDEAPALHREAEQVATPLGEAARVWLAMGRHHGQRDELEEAVALFMRAAHQGGAATLVPMPDEHGQREARVSLAAGAEIRKLVETHGDALAQKLAERGRADLEPHQRLARFERLLNEPGRVLPQIETIQKVEADAGLIEVDLAKAKENLEPTEAKAKDIAKSIKDGEDLPPDKLDDLKAKLQDATAAHDKAKSRVDELTKKLADARQASKDTRQDLTDTLAKVDAMKDNRVETAERLLAIARLYPKSTVWRDANLLAAHHLIEGDAPARAEIVLRQLVTSNDASFAAAGRDGLARLFEKRGLTRQATLIWLRLAETSDDVRIARGDDTLPARDVAVDALKRLRDNPPPDAQQRALSPAPLSADSPLIARRTPMPPYETLWSDPGSGRYYLLGVNDGRPSEFLENHLLMLNQNSAQLEARDVSNGNTVWKMSLKSDGGRSTSTSNGRLIRFNDYSFPSGRLVRHEHIGLLQSNQRIAVFSLMTGKMLWETDTLNPSEGGDGRSGWYYPYPNPTANLAIGGDVVVEFGVDARTGAKQVRAMDIATGQVRWMTEFESQDVIGVGAGQEFVGVFLKNGTEAIICDALTGEARGRISLSGRASNQPILWCDQGLLYVHNDGATLLDLPSGEKRWTASTPRSNQFYTSNFAAEMVDDDTCFIANHGMFLLDMKTGKATTSVSDKRLGRYVHDFAVSPDGSEIYVIGNDEKNQQVLSIIDTKANKIRTSITLGQRYYAAPLAAREIAAAGELIPTVVPEAPEELANGARRFSGKASIKFFRKSDGTEVDVSLPGVPNDFTGGASPIVRGNVIIHMRNGAIVAFRHKPGEADAPLQPAKPALQPPKIDTTGVDLSPDKYRENVGEKKDKDAKEEPKEAPKEGLKEAPKEAPQDAPKEAPAKPKPETKKDAKSK